MHSLKICALILALACAHAAVPTIPLRNGVLMPAMACGVGIANDSAAEAMVSAALANGFNSIDTAHDYGNFKGVAQALNTTTVKREAYFVTSKVPGCGVLTQGLQPPCFANTQKLALASIDALGLETVDLMLLHFPPILGSLEGCKIGSKPCIKMQEQWAALEDLYAANKTRAIGVSNYCTGCLQCILDNATVVPHVNQMQTHLGIPQDNHGVRSLCRTHGIVLEAYSPLGHGKVLKSPELQTVATAHNKSTAQVALRYVAQLGQLGGGADLAPFVTSSANPKHLQEDLEVFSGWELSAQEMSTLGAVTSPSCESEAPFICCH
eukprot:TRINITY_DN645_c0_g1_i5.p1 TRINITY_DN645_c0_g1~~TRINITY_DN645_c0_g1_i5.p1  ORF type:complete len:323 (+),score=77.69 TRINITY_DN645_c0_g1_i5:225-1193(+)